MSTKKIAYYALLTTLTIGASLILGLLSFGGFFAIYPFASYAGISFVLSVAYEGEIYFQNIKNALKKLLEPNFVDMELARSTLLLKFKTKNPQHTQLSYKNYIQALKLSHSLSSAKQNTALEIIEEELYTFEKKFLKGLLNNPTFQSKLKQRRWQFNLILLFSALSAIFMSLGTTYLLIETFSVIPFLATMPVALIPALIAPMALIAGIAYGLLTFNAVTEMVNNNTFHKWFSKLSLDIKTNGLTKKNMFMASSALILSLLALALTVCTAGTWWTIVKNTPPLFRWMRYIPRIVMSIIHPIIISTSSLIFILENTSNSLEMIDEIASSNTTLLDVWSEFKKNIRNTYQRENIWQFMNPARLLLVLLVEPLLATLFIGHLISVALCTNRMPGLSDFYSALIGFISEGFEDLHYFTKPQNDCSAEKLLQERLGGGGGHSHEDDFPRRVIMLIASPLYAAATYWERSFKNPESTPPEITSPIITTIKTVIQPKKSHHKPGHSFFKDVPYCFEVLPQQVARSQESPQL